MGANKNQYKDSHQRDTICDKFVIFAKLVRPEKNKNSGLNMCNYVSKVCAKGIFVSFSQTKYVKRMSKIALFFK